MRRESITVSTDFLFDLAKELDDEKRRCKLLFEAILTGNEKLIDILLPKVQNKANFYPEALFNSARTKHINIMNKLLEDGANINQECNSVGESPLHIAAENGAYTMVKHLQNEGADINKKSELGLTPLHKAGSEDVIEILLENGADLEAEDNCGLSPLHWAIETQKHNLVAAFLLRGAKLDTNKLSSKSYKPGNIVSNLIVKCKVAKIYGNIANLQPTKECIDDSYEVLCKEELDKLAMATSARFKGYNLNLLDLLKEEYKELPFLRATNGTYHEQNTINEFYRSSKSCIYKTLLVMNLKRAERKFNFLLEFSSNDAVVNVNGHDVKVTLPPEIKRDLLSSAPAENLKMLNSTTFN